MDAAIFLYFCALGVECGEVLHYLLLNLGVSECVCECVSLQMGYPQLQYVLTVLVMVLVLLEGSGGVHVEEVFTSVEHSRDKSWGVSEVGKLVPHSFLISLRVDSSAAVSDAVASLRDAVGSEDFEEVRVFQALRDVTAPAMAGEQRRNTPHILARLSPLGVERVRVHPLVQAVEQDRVMGLVEGQFGNATCQQQSR